MCISLGSYAKCMSCEHHWLDVGSVSRSQTEHIPLLEVGRTLKAGSCWVGWRADQEHRAAAWQGSTDT